MAIIILKDEHCSFTIEHSIQMITDIMAISIDPDQTVPSAVWSGTTLFAQTCLSESLGSVFNIYMQR